MKVGLGFDVHRFTPGRPLVLGGVRIPAKQGLAGHSDADVALHALMDALLGAASLGSIGQHFPSTDVKYKDVSSLLLLDEVMKMLKKERLRVVNVDIVITAEDPPITPHVAEMQKRIGQILEVRLGQVSIKATTTEGLGFVGRKEGIAAQAVVLLEEV
jgi:2-C-methyl-D-erythritol 2,4-cyclodiphosphate synthase